jgi:DNA-binding HxlR family transcriptional regulator
MLVKLIIFRNHRTMSKASGAVDEAFCPRFHRAAELVGRRWTGAIVRALLHGVVRFRELEGTVPGLSGRMLSERLKELESEGVVERVVFDETPIRIEYQLTEKGQALGTVVVALTRWAHDWLPEQAGDPPEPARHATSVRAKVRGGR